MVPAAVVSIGRNFGQFSAPKITATYPPAVAWEMSASMLWAREIRGTKLEGKNGNFPVAHPGNRFKVARRVHEPDDNGAFSEHVNIRNGRWLDTEYDFGTIEQFGPAGHNLRAGGREKCIGIIRAGPRIVLYPYHETRFGKFRNDLGHGRNALFPRDLLLWNGDNDGPLLTGHSNRPKLYLLPLVQ